MENSRNRRQSVISEDGGHKLEMRAASELAFRENGLLELVEVLEGLEVPYFLADGTLLGAARDGDFIPWDPDVGIWLKAEVFFLRKEEMMRNLTLRGFSVHEVGGRDPKLNAYKYSEKFELESWRLSGQKRVRGVLWTPAHFLDTPGQVELRKRLYPCPSPVEEFLSHRYGKDWRIPKVLSEYYPGSQTLWGFIKIKVYRASPHWLLRLLGKG